jgi:hypothetical protein
MPAMTRNKAAQPICRDHYEHEHDLSTAAELRRRGIESGKGAHYLMSKMSHDLSEAMKTKTGRDWAIRLRDRMNSGELLKNVQIEITEAVLNKNAPKTD